MEDSMSEMNPGARSDGANRHWPPVLGRPAERVPAHKTRARALWLAIALQVGLAVMFLFSAVSKLNGGLEEMREHLQIASWFWLLTGLVEIVGATGMLAGLKYPRLTILAGLWLAATMVGAIFAHLRVGDPPTDAIGAVVLLVLALTVAALRRRAGQVDEPVAMRSRERALLKSRDV